MKIKSLAWWTWIVEEPSYQFHKSPKDITDKPGKSLASEESCDSSV